MKTAAKLRISGRVQGVWYRASTSEKAGELVGLSGWVKNMADGTVGVHVEGEREEIEKLIKWCREGPPLAKVKEVEVKWVEATNKYTSFGTRW